MLISIIKALKELNKGYELFSLLNDAKLGIMTTLYGSTQYGKKNQI